MLFLSDMFLLKLLLTIQVLSGDWCCFGSKVKPTFNSVPCENNQGCNYHQVDSGFQCSLCAENQSGEKRCLATFLDNQWFMDQCSLPTTCNITCGAGVECNIEHNYVEACFCADGFYGQTCEYTSKLGDVYLREIKWHRANAFVKPGEITRFRFKVAVDAHMHNSGVYRMFKTGLGNIVNLGEAGKRGNAPTSLYCIEKSGTACTYQYEDYVDLQIPYLLPENEQNVTVLKMKDKLIGYVSEIDVKTMINKHEYINYNFKVFVDYEHVPVMKCIPVIHLTNCARSFAESSKSVFYRNENIVINYNVKYLEDGAYLTTARENRQTCSAQDTTWTWTWSTCSLKNVFNQDGEMIEEGSAIGNLRIFPEFSLELGTYRINLRIKRVIKASTNENFDECYFQVKPLPLEAVIDGGEVRSIIKDGGLSLTAKHSYDPNQPDNEQGSLMMLWTCECLTKNIQNCEKTCKMNKKPVWISVQQEFFVYSNQLQYSAEYRFTLTVDSTIRYKDKKIAPQFSHVIVKVANESVKAVTNYFIECVQNCVRDETLPNEILFLKAKVSVSGKMKTKVNESVQFNWVYSKANDSVLHPVEEIKLTDLPSSMLAIKEDSFEQGASYTIMLKEHNDPEYTAQYSFKISSVSYEGGCKVEPQSGVKGLTSFDITCDGSKDFVYEFYDKSEEDLAENVVFNGNVEDCNQTEMLGSSEFHGALNDVRITRGHISVYIMNKTSGLFIKKELKVELSPWNITDQRMEEIKENLTSTVNLYVLTTTMNYISFIPDTLPEQADKLEMLDLLLEPISKVRLNTMADVKLSASTMNIVLQTLNKPTPLVINLELIWKTLVIIRRQADIIENTLISRSASQWMPSKEVKLVATALLECLNTALRCESARTTGLAEENTGFDTLFLLRQNAQTNGEILDKIKDILCHIQAPGLPPVKVATSDKSFQIWALGNDEEYPVTEMLKKDDTIPFRAPQRILQTYSVENKHNMELFFQAALIDRNVFSWSKSDVKSKLVSLSIAISNENEHGFKKVKLLSSPVFVRLGMENNLTKTTVKGKALQLDSKLDPDVLDMAITIHRIDTPPKGYITIRFLYPPTNETLRVLVMEDYRPDYELMTHSKDVVIINSSHAEYPLHHRPIDLPMFLYMGVLPNENATVNHTVEYEFEVTTNLCQLWVSGQWSSIGCGVSAETTSQETVCACNHLSIFAAAFPVPPQSIDPFADTKLFLTVLDNPLVVTFVILLFIIYLILVLWGRYKDNTDGYKGKVIVLDDNFPEDSYPYLVAVHTSPRFNAGTTAHVGIKLLGKEGNSRSHILSSERRKVLTRNSDDWFMLYTAKSLGGIYGIHIWHDNYGSRPEWYCSKVVVYDLTQHTESVFIVEQWLALREGDFPEANLVIATGQEMLNMKRMFLNNSVLGFRDSHVFLSVFVRHPRSEVTRVERLSVLMCSIMVAMLCSIMFYTPDDASPTDDYQYDVGLREIIISVQTLFITAALTLVVLISFKRSYKVFHEQLPTTRQYRKDEIADAISRESRISGSQITEVASGQMPIQNQSFYKNYVQYVSKYLKGPPLVPVYMWDGEKTTQKRKIWYTVAWLSCIMIIIGAGYFVMLYGLKLGFIQSQKWLTSLLMTIGEDIFVMTPGRIIFVAILLSVAFQMSTKVDLHGIVIKDAMFARPKNELMYLNILIAKRSHPMYAPLSSSARWASLKKKEIRRKWWNLIDFVNAIFYVTIVSAVIYRLWISHYHGVNHLHKVFSHIHRKGFDIGNVEHVNNISMVRDYMELTYVEVLFDLWWYNEQLLSIGTEPEGIRRYWIEDGLHKAISKPLVRQVRVVRYQCSNVYFTPNRTNCLLKWSLGNKDKNVYGEKWVPATYLDTTKQDSPWEYRETESVLWWTNQRFYGTYGTLYDVSGYGTFIGPTLKEAQTTLAELRENEWQDWYTRACFLSTTVYNVNEHTFTQITMLFEYYVDGSMYTSITVIPVTRIIQFGVWELLFFLAAVYYVFRSGYLINRLGLIDYLRNLNNVTRVVNVFLAFLAIVIWCVHHRTSIKYSEKYMKSVLNDYFDFDRFVSTFSLLQVVLSLLLCSAIARAFMCVRGGRRFLNAYYTLIISLNILFWLTLGFLILLFVFKRLNYYFGCQLYFRTKELTLSEKMTWFLSPSLLENLNIQVFVVLRVVVMFFVHALFVVLYLYFTRIAKTYNPKNSDSFNFVLFVIERVKVCYGRDKNVYR